MVLAKELRQAVLRAAMQGSLTYRLNTDSSVDDLLIDIKDKKNDMIVSHIIGKEKPYSTQTKFDEQPYEIPDNWRYERFGTIMINRDAERIPLSASSRACKEKKYDYYGASGVIDKTDSFLFDKELLLIGEDGANLLARSTPIAFIASGKYWVNNHAHVLDACCGLNLQYICYYINSIDLSIYVTGTAQPKMNQSNMNAIWVPVPPIEEQQRIVDKINEIMPKIDEYEKIEKELETLKKEFPTNMKDALLQAAMQGKLTEQLESDRSVDGLLEAIRKEKDELIAQRKIKKEKPLPDIEEEDIPFDIPHNWRWVRLKSITYSGGQKIPDKCFSYIDIGSIDNVHQKLNNEDNIIEADKAPSRARKIVKYGDVLYATVRPYLHNMCIIDRNFKEEPIASTGFAVMTCCKGILNKFLLFYMLSPEFDRYANSTENAKGMAYPAINDDKFYRALIPIPPIEEQRRIVDKLEALLPLCEDLKEM